MIVPENQPHPLPGKMELAAKIKKYIDHCCIVSENSSSSEYKSHTRTHAIDNILDTLYPMLKAVENNSMKDICQFTLIRQRDLINILPVHNNLTYKTSSDNLYEIINECKLILQNIQDENFKKNTN